MFRSPAEIAKIERLVNRPKHLKIALMEIAVAYQTFIPVHMPKAAQRETVSRNQKQKELQLLVRDGLAKLPHGYAKKLADALGIQESGVAKIKSFGRKIQGHEKPIIEEFFRTYDPSFEGPRVVTLKGKRRGIPIIGYVGAGGREYRYDVDQDHIETIDDAPVAASESTVAVQIRGDSLGTMFERGYAFYDQVRSGVTDDMVGRLCVVGLADKSVLIKQVRLGKQPGRFDLISERGDPIRDAEIEWAAPVKAVSPGR